MRLFAVRELNRHSTTAPGSCKKEDEGKYSAKACRGVSDDATQGEHTFENWNIVDAVFMYLVAFLQALEFRMLRSHHQNQW
ncbi:hypothetical protein CBP51_11485 [Cellvibrio mixtus]|uniref:Uncharacterized protein n=1 Tax=Cellvibrio mixtus TaxID=39650 RepID=A0A266QDW6_9GAMM|nr:hypothetical protein CBP51_11485 [Cellvibrio mixtus]